MSLGIDTTRLLDEVGSGEGLIVLGDWAEMLAFRAAT